VKTRTTALLSITILGALLLGAFGVQTISAATKTMYYFWYPYSYSLDQSPPQPWTAYIIFLKNINPSTILLEGKYVPTSTKYILSGWVLTVYFNGYDVVAAIMPKLPHMSPGTFKVSLTMTLKLNDGTAYSGTATISVTDPAPPPP